MKIIYFVILLTVVSGTAFGKDDVIPFEYSYNISVSSKIFSNLSGQDMSAAFNVWAKTALKGKVNNDNLRTYTFNNADSLKETIRQRSIDCYVIPAMDLVQGFIPAEKVLLPIKEEDKFTQYVVLVNKDRAIKNLSDLKNRKLIFHDAYDMDLARTWLKHSLTSGATREANIWPLNLSTTDKPMKGIYQVFFGQSDAVVVSLKTFKTVCLLNPQLEQKLGILLRSPKFIPMAFVFDSRLAGERQDVLRESILGMHTTSGGKQVLTIFGCTRVEEHPIAIMDETFAFLKESSALD